MQADFVQQKKEHLLLHLYVQPRASRNAIVGLYNNALKVRIQAPPVENAANQMCLKFLAKALKISPKSLELVSGQGSRRKTVKITLDQRKTLTALAQQIRTLATETS